MDKKISILKDTFYKPNNEFASFVQLGNELVSFNQPIYAGAFIITDKLENLFEFLNTHYSHRVLVTEGNFYLFEYPTKTKEHRLISYYYQDRNLLVCYGCERKEIYYDCFRTLRRALSPKFANIFLNTIDIRRTFDSIIRNNGADRITVREYVSKGLIEDEKSVKEVKTNREWTEEDYEELFDELLENKRWLTSISIDLKSGHQKCNITIYRPGLFVCKRNFGLFVNVVLPHFFDRFEEGKGFFEKRSPETSLTMKSQPVIIEYKESVFIDRQHNERLVDVLSRFQRASTSIIHVNPYVHVSLLDNSDGSSYDVWVLAADKILINPKGRATLDSMERLTNHICEHFQEGYIKNIEDIKDLEIVYE